jgi:hypothetical protein
MPESKQFSALLLPPLGDYETDDLLNFGTNRWAYRFAALSFYVRILIRPA